MIFINNLFKNEIYKKSFKERLEGNNRADEG